MVDRAHETGAEVVVVHLGDFGFRVLDPGTRKYLSFAFRLAEERERREQLPADLVDAVKYDWRRVSPNRR